MHRGSIVEGAQHDIVPCPARPPSRQISGHEFVQQLADSWDAAKAAPFPEPEELLTDVYVAY